MASATTLLRVDAIQTATPGSVTTAGRARRVPPSSAALLRSRFQAVLYYREAGGEEEGEALKVAAWMKESLSAALPEHPVLAGRLRRDEQGGGGWEVKLNDSGVRLVQATAEMTMSELMEAKDAHEKELRLAYWEDGDPEHSSLFCVQVTKFQGDGYSIGISCSLLLADPLFLSNFIRAWAHTHTEMLSRGLLTESPMFHLAYFQKPAGTQHPIKPVEVESNPIDAPSAPISTMLFKVNQNSALRSYGMIATACLQETTRRLETRNVSNFTLVISDHAGDVKVESCNDTGAGAPSSENVIDTAWWDQLGLDNTAFVEKNKPLHLSHRVVSSIDEGLVVIMVPETSADLLISVTVPNN